MMHVETVRPAARVSRASTIVLLVMKRVFAVVKVMHSLCKLLLPEQFYGSHIYQLLQGLFSLSPMLWMCVFV